MAVNKKNLKLNDAEPTPLDIVGIVCQENDVRLCWLIGQATGTILSRTDNFTRVITDPTAGFARYSGTIGPEESSLVLLQNKAGGRVLFDSARQFDYIIVTTNGLTTFVHFCEQLKRIPEIQAVYPLEQTALKGISEVISL